jgi:hypothetical protein
MRYQKQVGDLTEFELSILHDINSLLQQLPGNLADYLPAISELRRKFLNSPGRGRGDGRTHRSIRGRQARAAGYVRPKQKVGADEEHGTS